MNLTRKQQRQIDKLQADILAAQKAITEKRGPASFHERFIAAATKEIQIIREGK